MHDQKRDTAQPEEKKANHRRRINALGQRNGVFERKETRPDGAQHDAHGIGSVHVLDCEPEDCEDGARDDGDVGAPETPRGARNDRKGNMMDDTDCAVERDDEGDDEEGEADYAKGFAPCQTWWCCQVGDSI